VATDTIEWYEVGHGGLSSGEEQHFQGRERYESFDRAKTTGVPNVQAYVEDYHGPYYRCTDWVRIEPRVWTYTKDGADPNWTLEHLGYKVVARWETTTGGDWVEIRLMRVEVIKDA
jgi:hypothetical protein